MPIQVGLSLMIEDDFHQATEALFDRDLVEVVEWTFDMGWGRPLPDWLQTTLHEYSASGNLLGHGVSYSPLDASSTDRQDDWLDRLSFEVSMRKYRHLTEHFGLSGGGNFHASAPLPVPLTPESVAVGQARMQQLAETANVPIGLENLAFAFGVEDVKNQGRFLDELLTPVDGFLLLDLHNLYCQMCNFEIPADRLVDSYPLHRVRELHVSGGSWSEVPESDQPIRRDTHDEAVPEELFELVARTIPKCPNLQAVILERLGGTFSTTDKTQFQRDYERLLGIVQEMND